MQAQLAGMDTKSLDRVRKGFTDGSGTKHRGMLELLNATGAYRVESVRAHSAVENFTTALQKRDVTMKDAIRNHKLFNSVLREQYAIQKMQTMSWSKDARGRITADAIIPREVPQRIGSLKRSIADVASGTATFGQVARETSMRVGLMSEVVRSAGHNMVNLGKNTQWAGRQMMVGIGVPFAAFGVAAGVAAYQVDKEMTRIAKVYDYTSTNVSAEMNSLKADSMSTAKEIARTYGMAAEESLNITAAFAATGEQGVKLQQLTKDVAAASLLGELDRQKAIDTTISLNTVFADSNISVGDSFKYMNSLENATSLSMQDMTEAIPRLSGVVKGLGGDITDIGTLMAAARAAGENAAEAANTLKSVSFRNAVPTKKAQDVFKQFTDVDLKQLVDRTQGEVIPTIEALNAAMKNLSGYERIQVMRDLQGLWKGSKANNIMNQFLGEGSEMVQRAREVAKGGAEAWNETWDQELGMIQNSASGKWKIALATLKTELADIGEPFLEVATQVAGAITKVLTAFNGLDEGRKKLILMTLGVISVGTVGVMLLGVFMNLIGTVIKTGASLGMLVTRFKSLNIDQQISALTAKQASGAMLNEAEAANLLALQINRVSEALKTKAGMEKLTSAGALGPGAAGAGAVGVLPGLTKDKAGRYRHAAGSAGGMGGKFANAGAIAAAQSGLALEQSTNAERTKGRQLLNGQRQAMLGSVGVLGLMLGGTNKWVQALSTGLMVATMMPGPINKLGGVLGGLGTKVAGKAALGGAIKGVAGVLPRLAPLMGPFGIALGAAAIAGSAVYFQMKRVKGEVEAVSQSAKGWAEVLNFSYEEFGGGTLDENGEKIMSYTDKINKFKDANEGAYNSLNNFKGNDNERMARAMEEGMKVALHGGSKEAAEEAVVLAYQIMGDRFASKAEEEKFMMKIGVDFSDLDKVAERQMQSFSNSMRDAAKNNTESGWFEDITRLGGGDSDMNWEAEELVKQAAREMWNAFDQTSEEGRAKAFDNMKKALLAGVNDVWDGLDDKQRDLMKKNGIDSAEELFEEYVIAANKGKGALQSFFRDNGITGGTDQMNDLRRALLGGRDGLREIADVAGMSKEEVEKVNFFALRKSSGALPMAKQGLKDTGDTAKATAEEIQETANAMEELKGSVEGMANSAAKSMLSDAMSTIAENAQRQVADRHEAHMERLKRNGEATLKRIDDEGKRASKALEERTKAENDRWKIEQDEFKKHWEGRKQAAEDAADAEIKRTQDAIDAEKNAETERQAIFEREKSRVQRLADLHNQNLDFNIALNSGDLDEAARIGNNVRATTEGWAADDAMAGSLTASEKRIAASEEKIKLVEAEKEATLAALEAEEEAAQLAAEAAHDRRVQALEDEKELQQEALAHRRQVEGDKQKAAEDSAQKSHEALKRALDADLKAWSAYIPTSQEDLREHTGKLQGIYNDHDLFLDTKSVQWSSSVQRAIDTASAASKASLQSDIDWALYGEKAAADFIQGAFGIDMNTFKQTFGIPGATATPSSSNGGRAAGAPRISNGWTGGLTIHDGGPAYHDGGKVKMQGSRTGYPAGAQRRPSEVDTRLKVGEYVVKDKAVRKLGIGTLNQINQGVLPTFHEGGPVGGGGASRGLGMPGVMVSMMAAALRGVMEAGVNKMMGGMMGSVGTAAPGQYGNSNFDAEQLRNALAIVNTGRSMQMTDRDIMIGLMTAMQESSLRNIRHGDTAGPDSRGLFQQRAPWGPEAVRMDPNGSARLFFEALKKVEDRNTLQPSMAAQRVQRSAHPMAYAKWQDEAQAILSMLGGSLGGGQFQTNGEWPARRMGVISPNTQAGANYIRQRWGLNNIGILGQRANASDHPWGKALDAMIPNYRSPQGIQMGNEIAQHFVDNPNQFGTKYVIWRQMINSGGGWKRMENRGSDTANHLDHPHISFKHGGGLIPEMRKEGIPPRDMAIPQLFTGGDIRYDNTLANLHRDETVLTAPLSEELRRGIGNLDSSGGNSYSITMDLRGSTIDSNFDIEGALEQAINKRESRVGRSRVVR